MIDGKEEVLVTRIKEAPKSMHLGFLLSPTLVHTLSLSLSFLLDPHDLIYEATTWLQGLPSQWKGRKEERAFQKKNKQLLEKKLRRCRRRWRHSPSSLTVRKRSIFFVGESACENVSASQPTSHASHTYTIRRLLVQVSMQFPNRYELTKLAHNNNNDRLID